MSASVEIVKRIEDKVESREPLDRVLRVFDVGMVRMQFDSGIEFRSHLFRDQCLGFLDVFLSEEELSVEITQIYRVEIDDVNFAETRLDEIFEEFAANTACTNEKNARLTRLDHWNVSSWRILTSPNFPCMCPKDCF